jgi:hypothetical protein
VTKPADVPAGVTEQLSGEPDRLHVVEVKETLPVPPDWEKVIVSPAIELPSPVTVAAQLAEEPTATDDGTQVMEVRVAARVTVNELVFELAALLVSPGYEAWIVGDPTATPVTVTEHPSGDPERLQVAPEGKETLPVPPNCDKVIVSPAMEPLSPVTVAVQEAEESTSTDDGRQETEVEVTASVTVNPKVPELAALPESPG